MAKEEKAAEEARAMEAEKNALAAKVRQEEIENEARLARLQSTVEDEDGMLEPEIGDADAAHAGSADDDDGRSTKSWQSDESEFNGFSDDDDPGNDDEGVIEPDFVEDDEPMDMNINIDLDEAIQQYPQPEPLSRSVSPEGDALPTLSSEQSSSNPPALHENPPALPTPPSEGILDLESGLESSWASRMQLMTFRADATKIAEDYLKDRGVKLRTDRKRSTVVRDRTAYKQGKEDGKKIDVHQKMIKDEPYWEDEVASR